MPVLAGKTLTILAVEDDVAVAELLRAVFNNVSGWGTVVVHNAAAAREVFHHIRIDVLVLDVNLPGISGLELLALLRQDPSWHQPPVILISAKVDQSEITAAVEAGQVARFLAKPFDVDQLVEAVQTAVPE